MSEVLDSASDELMNAIEDKELVLPSMPEAAMRIQQAADDQDANLSDICDLIGADAAIAARIIKIANSAMFRGVNHIDNLQRAVGRMGIPFTCNVAVGIAMEQLFVATSEAVDDRMRASWAHSLEVATVSNVYCQQFTKLKADKATLAGLVHEIGKLPILTWADQNDWDGDKIDEVTARLQMTLGEKILTMWDFPDDIVHVPCGYLDFDRQAEKADYVDLVTVANLHSHIGTDHALAKVDWREVTAFERLGIDVEQIIADSDFSAEIAEASSVLG